MDILSIEINLTQLYSVPVMPSVPLLFNQNTEHLLKLKYSLVMHMIIFPIIFSMALSVLQTGLIYTDILSRNKLN